MSNSLQPLKITIVGDGKTGKTSLLMTYTQNEFPEEYIPKVFQDHPYTIRVDDKEYSLNIWDTSGMDDYDRLRPLNYPGTSCYLLCYSIDSRASFENIKNKWWPEIHHYSNDVPVVLVGTKLDLRIANSETFVTTAEGRRLKEEIHAYSLVECSALKKIYVQKVFEEVVNAVEKKPKSKPQCIIL